MGPRDHQLSGQRQVATVPDASLVYELCGETLVLVHARAAVTDGDWITLCDVIREHRPAGVLVFAPSGCPGPDAGQRRHLTATMERAGGHPVAVLTRVSLHRHIITALNWLGGGSMRAFSPDELDAACSYVGLTSANRSQVLATAERLARGLRVESDFPVLDSGA